MGNVKHQVVTVPKPTLVTLARFFEDCQAAHEAGEKPQPHIITWYEQAIDLCFRAHKKLGDDA